LAEILRYRWLRVGIPDFDEDALAVARQRQPDGGLLLCRRGVDRVGDQLGNR